MKTQRENQCILFDWGDTLMRVFPEFEGPMVTWPQVEAMPHAGAVLSKLRSQALLAVATNAADSEEWEIRAALDKVGLDTLLDKVYCYRKIGHKKPSREFFAYILEDLGLQKSQVIMVGDDFEADVVGANKCGIRALWYNLRTAERHESTMHQTVHDLCSLPQILDSFWNPGNLSG
jgi:putative hydrolase of the HAD superfamily